MKAYERGYLRARAEISADKDGDIFGQKRRYLPAKPHKGLTDKVHIVVIIHCGHNSANGSSSNCLSEAAVPSGS